MKLRARLPLNCTTRVNNKIRGCAIYVNFFFFPPYSKHREDILSELQTVEKVEKQLLKEPNSVQMIDARAAKLSDYKYPITKSSNWTAVIGYPRDRATIAWQIGARRTNHERVFCYRCNYRFNELKQCLCTRVLQFDAFLCRSLQNNNIK